MDRPPHRSGSPPDDYIRRVLRGPSAAPPGDLALSSRTIPVAALWIPAADWRRAQPMQRARWLRYVAAEVHDAKRKQIESGVGADGRPLRRVRPTSRPDGTTDRPLIPHDDASRTLRLLRVTANVARGDVTIHWGYWTTIVVYHAEGAGYLPVRDVIGTPGRFLRPVKARAIRAWYRIAPTRVLSGPDPLPRRRA